jgi:thiol:disulfide interchange protein
MYKKIVFLSLLLCATLHTLAQIENPASWSFSSSKPNAKAGDVVELIIKAKIKKGWHLYSNGYTLDPGPLPTTFSWDKSPDYELVGTAKAIGDKSKYDEIFEGTVRYFNGKGEFRQKVKLLADNAKITGTFDGQVCTDSDGRCVPVSGPMSFTFSSVATNAATTTNSSEAGTSGQVSSQNTATASVVSTNTPITTTADTTQATATTSSSATNTASPTTLASSASTNPANGSLWWFFVQAFLGGLVALLTPCVYPIIPMTVSFFTKQKRGISMALLYGFFIVLIYVLFGTIISFLFGQTAPNYLSTNWLPNILFFIIFVIFGLSFLGWFEITLPHSLVNKMDANADKGGILGVFFMAFTLVLVSFSCTGPIAGTILGMGAQGQVIKPIVGMLGFSLAFAIPFTMFAIFPNLLHNLPKSGGWLNTVKVNLGFLELALALKFLSTADLAYHWNILDREVYLALWIAIFTLLGLYLIGKITLPHDSKTDKVSVPKLFFSIPVFAFVIYLIPGLWGAPLKALSGWLPPLTTFDAFGGSAASNNQNAEVKYGNFLHLPHGIKGYFDYKEALAAAKAQNKPLFIDFTGHGCVNCRKMEENVWIDPKILKKLKEEYIVVALYVDDKTPKPEAEWYTSESDGAVKKTIGAQNHDFEITKFKGNAQPYYCLVDPQTEQLIKPPYGYNLDLKKFYDFISLN